MYSIQLRNQVKLDFWLWSWTYYNIVQQARGPAPGPSLASGVDYSSILKVSLPMSKFQVDSMKIWTLALDSPLEVMAKHKTLGQYIRATECF